MRSGIIQRDRCIKSLTNDLILADDNCPDRDFSLCSSKCSLLVSTLHPVFICKLCFGHRSLNHTIMLEQLIPAFNSRNWRISRQDAFQAHICTFFPLRTKVFVDQTCSYTFDKVMMTDFPVRNLHFQFKNFFPRMYLLTPLP